MCTATALPSTIAATSVSASVVMFAPMMYGIDSSRLMYPRLASGTSTVSATETESVSVATRQPSANIGHGRFNHSSRLPPVRSPSSCGRTRSRKRNEIEDDAEAEREQQSTPGASSSRSRAGPQM